MRRFRGELFMLAPIQPKLPADAWGDSQIKSFLGRAFTREKDNDYYLPQAAYRQMDIEDFERFISLFGAWGNNLYAKQAKGRTLWSVIAKYRQGAESIKSCERMS